MSDLWWEILWPGGDEQYWQTLLHQAAHRFAELLARGRIQSRVRVLEDQELGTLKQRMDQEGLSHFPVGKMNELSRKVVKVERPPEPGELLLSSCVVKLLDGMKAGLPSVRADDGP